jgi:hypothetical protein
MVANEWSLSACHGTLFFVTLLVFAFVWQANQRALPLLKGAECPRVIEGGGSAVDNPLRLLVSVAAFHVPVREPYLFRVLETYLAYSNVSVDLIVDTNSPALRDLLLRRFPVSRITVNVLDVADMRRFRSADLEAADRDMYVKTHGSDFEDVTRAHRYHFLAHREKYDFFLYSEDDVAVSEASFHFFLDRYRVLWKKNWLFGFYRTEVSSSGNFQLPDHLRHHRIVDAPVLVAEDGHWYMQPLNSYCAFWLVDRGQLREFIKEGVTSHRFLGGEENEDVRAKMASGFHRGRVAGPRPFWPWQRHRDIWIPRVIHPIDRSGRLDPRAAVQHMPNNYVNHSSFGAPLGELFSWSKGGPSDFLVPLLNHITHPCP